MICRAPTPELRPFVNAVWSCENTPGKLVGPRELSLPSGSHHLVIRLGDTPLRIFRSPEDSSGEVIASAVLGGMRTRAVCKATDGTGSVGAVLRPDVLGLAGGMSPASLVDLHVPLGDLRPGCVAGDFVERVVGGSTVEDRLASFENQLCRLFRDARSPDPLVRHALLRLGQGARIDAVVEEAGVSHRHFCARFRNAVGLPPSVYRQVRRFDRFIEAASRPDRPGLAEISVAVGFADQAHMAREFRAISGLTFTRYERLPKKHPRHVPLPA